MILFYLSIAVQFLALCYFISVSVRRGISSAAFVPGAFFLFGMLQRRATALLVGVDGFNWLSFVDLVQLPLAISFAGLAFVWGLDRDLERREETRRRDIERARSGYDLCKGCPIHEGPEAPGGASCN